MYYRYSVSRSDTLEETVSRSKQKALEDAQAGALKNPFVTFYVWRHRVYPRTGMCDILPIVRYWTGEIGGCLQYILY